jgi:sRNA-binding protein
MKNVYIFFLIFTLKPQMFVLFRLRKAKRELQEEQWADQRKDKEEAAAKYRKRMEEKAKEKEEKNKEKNEQGKSDGSKVDEMYVEF